MVTQLRNMIIVLATTQNKYILKKLMAALRKISRNVSLGEYLINEAILKAPQFLMGSFPVKKSVIHVVTEKPDERNITPEQYSALAEYFRNLCKFVYVFNTSELERLYTDDKQLKEEVKKLITHFR